MYMEFPVVIWLTEEMFTFHHSLRCCVTTIGGHVVWFINKIFNWPLISHIISMLINGGVPPSTQIKVALVVAYDG